MASAPSKNFITNEERRWVVIGVCLTKVLTPALRNVLATEILRWYHVLCQPPTDIDKQVYGRHTIQLNPSTLDLNYKNINNNNVYRSPRAFDYAVKDPLSLAKLFVLPFMSKFTGFDQTMDISAILSVITEAAPFSGAAVSAKTVRADIRNEWAHCNFANWTEARFITAFQSMETLLKNVNFSPKEEKELCDELNSWKDKGLQLCFGQPVDVEILTLLRSKVEEVSEAVQTWVLKEKQMSSLVSNISEIQANLHKEIDNLRTRVEKCEIRGTNNFFKVEECKMQGSNNSLRIERCEIVGDVNSKEIKLLEKKFTTELSRYDIKEEEKIPYVFSAPPRNRYFAGRTEEIQELKRILKVEETWNEKKVRVAAVCGLGGIGKTSLISEYAHQMKNFYMGGVYWFSAEDETFLAKTVNDIALRIGALLGSFDLNMSNTFRKISNAHNPSLIVLDCLDQLDLSSNMIKFISLPTHENIYGHFIVLTRRNPNRLVNDVSVFEENSCLQLKCLLAEEAKQFLFSRTGVTLDHNAETFAETLCEELGRLPLALEQAGACIRMLNCSLSSYLEQYKSERLRLLSQQPARPVSPGMESSERLAVHTTWCINMDYMRKSPNGHAAVRFMNACSFFNVNEIEEELINVGKPEVEDVAFRKCVSSPLGSRQVLKLLTDFSLFTYVEAHSVSTHRLVQELVREGLKPKWETESFSDAVRMLSYAFSKCSSPSDLVSLDEMNDEEQNVSISNFSKSPSHFYMWSKLCMHGHYLSRELDVLLTTPDPVSLSQVWFPETSKVLYECAVHLSTNHEQEKAKRTLNFAYRILDWVPVAGYQTVKSNVSNDSLFTLSIPLPKYIQFVIKRCSLPPFVVSLQPLADKLGPEVSGRYLDDFKERIEKLRLNGNKSYKEGCYKEALDAYSSAIYLSHDFNSVFNPLLLTNRATVFIKLNQYENALKDANSYITRRPDCWKGYARKALALDGLNEKVSAEIAASLAFYHNKAIFSDFLPFKESFLNLQERIFICDTVNQLLHQILHSLLFTKEEMKILVLGKEDYDIFGPCMRLSNCILVGARRNCPANLKFKGNGCIRLVDKCMATNLSFHLEAGQVLAVPGSFVKVLNCNFTNKDDIQPAVATQGEFNAEQCDFKNCTSGGLLCAGPGNAVVSDCSFCNNGKAGLEVREDGTLMVKRSRMYHNGLDGLIIGPKSSMCVAINCDIEHNDREGIATFESKNITLIRNNVFGNNSDGIYMTNSEADIRENNFFDNGLWGIWSQSNSWCNISMNKVFRNKTGGIRVGNRAAGKEFSQSVVELNEIYDNIGPGFVEKVNQFEVGSSLNTNIDLMKSYLKSSLQSAKCQQNEVYNNKESENVGKLNFSVPYCSNCRKKCELGRCRKCFTAVYCNKSCQENHWAKHKKLCKVLREKASFLVTGMKRVGHDGKIKRHAKGLEEVGPMFSPPPPRDGRRFVVKVATAIIGMMTAPYTLILYDRSLDLYEEIQSKVIAKLVREFGIQCELQHMEKKLFLYCLFEENGQLRIFINEFADFLKW